MKLETFGDVLASMKRNRDRKFHLLLGNGFSIAYDSTIFSYNALHDFIQKLDDQDLSRVLSVIETRNFELNHAAPGSLLRTHHCVWGVMQR